MRPHILRLGILIFAVLIAVPTFAAQGTERRLSQKKVEALSALPDGIELPGAAMTAAKKATGAVIPESDYPSYSLDVDGTGEIRLWGTVPKPTAFPIYVIARRADCVRCGFHVASEIYPQTTSSNLKARVTWMEVEEQEVRYESAYGGRFTKTGLREVAVLTLHPSGIWMMSEFDGPIGVEEFDFGVGFCLDEAGVEAHLYLAALDGFGEGSRAALTVPGLDPRSGRVAPHADNARRGDATVTIAWPEYAPYVGQEVPVAVTLNGVTLERSVYFYELQSCDGWGKG